MSNNAPLVDQFQRRITYLRLSVTDRCDLRAALRSDNPGDALNAALDVAMKIKPERHHFVIDRKGAAPTLARHMSMTGG